jgi:mRNA-degrading endonuclease YafQ of YafQ-DinJ toxin-antitoxin module
MHIEFKKSFYKCFVKYDRQTQQKIYNTIESLIDTVEKRKISKGLGIKLLIPKLKIYEARCGLKIRIIFKLEKDLLEFALVGSHTDIKRFLKSIQ